MPITPQEGTLLRDLAMRVAEIAALPVMAERRNLWKAHNSLQRARPLILVFPEGSWRELLPESALVCRSEEARRIELELRRRLYYHEHIHDDTVIENEWIVPKAISNSGWGYEPKLIRSADPLGAYAFERVMHSLEDLSKLHHPQIAHDAEATVRHLAEAQALLGDILDVKLRGVRGVSFHFMRIYIDLRGMDQMMLDMYDNPEMLHATLSFLAEGYAGLIQQYEALNLLSLNNDSAYHSSGGNGYTDELPRPGYDPQRIRPCDMWASAESQELALVSPAQHAEFALRYERPLLERFGLTGYGCCEDLTKKLDDVLAIPNMRRVSISPFANVDACAERLGNRYIFSWKPHPAHLVGEWDGERVRRYIQHTVDVAKDGVLEMVLKDTHTCDHQPKRFTAWTDIAREIAENAS